MQRGPTFVGALVVALLLASCAAPATSQPPPGPPPSGRPNIVFVLTDDLASNLADAMPHVVAMQQAGETMSRYYVTDSLCCPSRSAIFTGEYPHDDGVFTNSGADGGYGAFTRNGDEARSFAVALQGAGYRTGFMGKYLNGYRPTDPVPPGWTEWDVAGNGYGEFDYTLNENGTPHAYGHADGDYLVDVLGQKASAFIGGSTRAEQPFLLEVATFAPHAPYTPAPRYATADAGEAYPRTAAYDTRPSSPPSWLASRGPLTEAEQQKITAAWDERLEADRAVDDLLGTIQNALAAAGVTRDTYVVFSSDNGYHMGEYRLMPGKQTAFDTDVDVPLVVTGPGVPAGRTTDALTSNVDLAPTFETVAGAPVGASVDGVSLDGLWHGRQPADWQQAVLIEHHGPNTAPDDPDAQEPRRGAPPSYDAVRTADALYVRYASGEQEYYDTRTDPHELANIAGRGVPPRLPAMLDALARCHTAASCQSAARP